jgi:DNA ligase-associated metallophosphoesterase
MSLSITIAGESLELLSAKALHWPRRKTLFIADPHWGKAAAFRAAGIAVSLDPLAADLERLGGLLHSTGASQLVILGDLFHAKSGRSLPVLDTITAWRAKYAEIEVQLIRGNHDRAAGDPPTDWRFECRAEPVIEPPFALKHFPGEIRGFYTLAGHLHPAFTLRGSARQRLRFPCFHFRMTSAILPAFGSFTGTAHITPASGERIFVVVDGEVIEVN